MEEECKNIKNNYDEFNKIKQASNDLFDSLEDLLNSQQNQNSKFNICSNINNIDISNKAKIKNIKFIKNKRLNIQNKKERKKIYKEQDSKEIKKENDLFFSQIIENKEISLNETSEIKDQEN